MRKCINLINRVEGISDCALPKMPVCIEEAGYECNVKEYADENMSVKLSVSDKPSIPTNQQIKNKE